MNDIIVCNTLMPNMKRLLPLIALAIVMSWQSCRNDDDVVVELDTDLRVALEKASPNGSIDFFVLPESDDLSAIPQDPDNPLTPVKVELGKLLFHETALAIHPKLAGGAGTYSCASCHHARAGFQAGRIQGIGEGGTGFGILGEGREPHALYPFDSLDVQPIRTPSALNSAYQEVQLWNGQFGAKGMNAGTESSWTAGTPKEVNHLGYAGVETQAIAGMNVHRLGMDSILSIEAYRAYFDEAFPEFTDEQRYTNECAGLAIAAYERTLLANKSPFQQWLGGNHAAMNDDEKRGAILFFGKAGCVDCHTGPALNSMEFHGLGMADFEGTGIYGMSPDDATKKGRGGFTNEAADMFKFKVPQLYSLSYSPFYGHGATFTTVRDVIVYKNAGIPENADVPLTQISEEFIPLGLSDEEIDMLTAFIENALDDKDLLRYEPVELPSGSCFPNNDEQSRIDLGCE